MAKEQFGGCDVLVNCTGVETKRSGQPVAPHALIGRHPLNFATLMRPDPCHSEEGRYRS